ncbi:MAG: alkaline shock response membrane anchor protein AmaP [Thermoflexales bacterium]|nr:alkaline shock response membrane anchor protein AmaP [Thermoflexales bacterium]
MNVLNRILVVIGLLIALLLGITLCIAPIPILEAIGQGLDGLVSWLETVPALARILLGVLFALAWMVICILLLVLELRRPPRRMVRVERVDGGAVEVNLKTINDHIAYELEQLPGVLRARSRASVRRNAVAVEVEVETAGDMTVPAQASQIVEAIRHVVEEKVGVRLAQPPQVRMHATPAPAIARRPVGGPPAINTP